MPRPAIDPIERFNRSYIVLPTGCWEWQLSRNVRDGYAQFSTGHSSTVRAAVWAYKIFVGPIPDGMTIEHRCHTADPSCSGGPRCLHRLCVNWASCLGLLTRGENARQSHKIQTQLAKTECPAGHGYSSENTWVYDGQRSCKTCCYARHLGLDPRTVPILSYAEMRAL